MLFILPGILVVGFAALVVWWFFFRSVLRHERTVREVRQREAEFERLLATPNEPLYCVSCQQVFRGPLDEFGCPRCQARAFVIPARATDDPRVARMVRRLPVPRSAGERDEEAPVEIPVALREKALSEDKLPQGNQHL